eukprot:GEMP01002799.1.p1 GENE.GEMP01002799.1~~GEMP01002799.1.p1  ORF type:complete len:601 (+),score=75.77 GEMP01002799.1:49-1851(+)
MPPKNLANGGLYASEFRNPVTTEEYHSLMDNALRGKRLDEAWQVLELMQQDGVKADKYAVSRCLMKTLSDSREHRKIYRAIALVERFVQSQPADADEVLFNSLLDACSRIQDVGRLEMTLQKMKEYGVAPSAVTLGILVKAFGRVGDMERVLDVWKKMHHQHIVANAVTYGCMIDACVKCGNLQMAQDVFQELKRMKKHRNTIIYTTLIKGFGASKDKDSALNLFREMQDEGVPCNTITYNSVIDACVRCHDLQRAVEVFDSMTQRAQLNPKEKLEPDLITYSTMIKGYCHVGDLDRALDLSRQLDDRSLQPDELVYNTLLDGCVRTNDLNTGVGLFEEMCTKQNSKNRLTPSAITFSILVRLYRRSGYQEEQAVAAVAHLFQAHGLPLREDTGFRDHSDTRRTPWKGKGKGSMRKGGKQPNPHAAHNYPIWEEPGMGGNDSYDRRGVIGGRGGAWSNVPLTPAPDVTLTEHDDRLSPLRYSPGGGGIAPGTTGAGERSDLTKEAQVSSFWSQPSVHAFTNSPSGNDPVVQQAMTRGSPHTWSAAYDGSTSGYQDYSGMAPPPAPPGTSAGPMYPIFDERPEYMDWTPRTPEQYASYPGY